MRRAEAIARVVLALGVIGWLASACYADDANPEYVEPLDASSVGEGRWQLLPIGGFTTGTEAIVPELVEVSADGGTLTAFFHAGNPRCFAVSGVDVVRRDPDLPAVTVAYGTRLGVTQCTADAPPLAIRVPLDPPFAR